MTAQVVKLRQPACHQQWSDEAVALACASRDPAAISELFDRFQPRVTRYLSRLAGTTAEVDDLVQSTFLEIAQGCNRFEGRSSVSSWLLGIATNVARHHLRSRSRRMRLLSSVRDALGTVQGQDPAQIAGARSELARAQEVLTAQPLERRLAFVLCELEGVAAKDVAKMLDTTETAIWKRVSEVRHALRAVMEEP